MAILSFGFNKIFVEKNTKSSKQINIKSGLHILDVSSSDMIKDAKQKAFSIKFKYDVDYEPKVGTINLEGDLLYLATEELAKKIEDTWNKNKSLPKEVGTVVFNRILQNCNIEALILSREINLPAPLQLPKISLEPKPAAKPAAKKNVPK
jgi:hypothetical protein